MYMSQIHICYIYLYLFTSLQFNSLLSTLKIATRQKSHMYMYISLIAVHELCVYVCMAIYAV